MTGTVREEDLMPILTRLRDLRRYAVMHNIDPWAFRQALLLALELDTQAALLRGISRRDLAAFDQRAVEDARRLVRGEVGKSG